MNSPIIIVGMHRSGTTLCTRLIQSMGVYVGRDITKHHESKYFQNINIELFNSLGSKWDNPPKSGFDEINNIKFQAIISQAEEKVNFRKIIKFFGLKNYFLKNKMLWGWKDPRNVYSLPIWLKVFPSARIIYIERHGVDVAKSLNKRFLNKTESGKKYKKFPPSNRCSTLMGAFSLWEEYMTEGRKNIKCLEAENLLKLRYEDLLESPQKRYKEIFRFLQKPKNSFSNHNILNQIDQNRAYAFRKDPHLNEFKNIVKERLHRFNY